jgi:hypothetical protein
MSTRATAHAQGVFATLETGGVGISEFRRHAKCPWPASLSLQPELSPWLPYLIYFNAPATFVTAACYMTGRKTRHRELAFEALHPLE